MSNVTEPIPTPRYRDIVTAANKIAVESGYEYVGAEHLFLAIIGDREAVPTQVLAKLIDLNQIEADLRAVMASDEYNSISNKVIIPPHPRDQG